MKIIDRAKSHFESLGVQSIEVEEWQDEKGQPTVIYWQPITLAEKKKLFSRTENLNDAGLLADVVIMKAIDKDGEKIFSLEDKLPIMHKVDSDVLSKIAVAMVQTPSPEELKKVSTDIELKNMLIVADRLKINLSELSQMSEYEFNLWVGFMLDESEQSKANMKK